MGLPCPRWNQVAHNPSRRTGSFILNVSEPLLIGRKYLERTAVSTATQVERPRAERHEGGGRLRSKAERTDVSSTV